MSSSSATASGSRSSSPATPEASDCLEQVAVHNDLEISSWYHSLQSSKAIAAASWETDSPFQFGKDILRLDDLIEEHAYDDSPISELNSTFSSLTPPDAGIDSVPALSPTTFSLSNVIIPSHNSLLSSTKPIPPPASRPRKRDSPTANQKVVFPPKESCYNLPIMVPSIPEGGTKSRVETQVRVTVDLADGTSSSGDPFKYDRVGSWKWLKLPQGTATKKRTRKQGKIDPVAPDILHLSAVVTCASPPHNRVLSCSSCQAREAKRVARKLAARVRPARSDSDSPEDCGITGVKSRQEDTTSIIQFNCAEVLDFSTGSVVLPLRITCYCRHHREKVGFIVHFTMMDDAGRIIGTGTSRPIMITDDHKSSSGVPISRQMSTHGFAGVDAEWPPANGSVDTAEMRAPSKRTAKETTKAARKRAMPYNPSDRLKASRENSVFSMPSPATSLSALPLTRSPTPPLYNPSEAPSRPQPSIFDHTLENAVSPSDIMFTPHDQIPDIFTALESLMPQVATPKPERRPSPVQGASSSDPFTPVMPHSMPFMFFDPGPPPPMSSLPMPKIHRLIPACGPTHGGIEVTILGANFHPSVQLHCVFGDVVASSTQRWSDNTLVCVLPARPVAGVVAVWFDGLTKEDDGTPPSLFTYSDESDRALMELALQVVGLKMTGKIEDAKNVAMRIVGNAGESSDSQNGVDTSDMMQLASTSSVRSIRPLLLTRAAGHSEDFESLIVDFLSILNTPLDHQSPTSVSSAISHQTSSGQTLLHLAAFLGFSRLVKFLVSHDIDLDARDRNGYSALHFAVVRGSKACAQILVEAGADMEIVNVLGRTPQEEAPTGFFEVALSDEGDSDSESDDAEGDEEAHWGDGEEDEDEIVHTERRRRVPRRVEHTKESAEDGVFENALPANSAAHVPSSKDKILEGGVDEKQTASFIDMIQRTLAQLYAAQGIMPNMPQLPLPNLSQLPGMSVVPWGALPQIPMVFPVFVPMPAWPSFLGEKRGEQSTGDGNDSAHSRGVGAIRAAQEWKATWEKWMALTMRQQQAEEVPPPMYTPRAAADEGPSGVEPEPQQHEAEEREDQRQDQELPASVTVVRPSPAVERPAPRPFDYAVGSISAQEVNAYGYQPTTKQSQKLQKKHDRMLLLFWLPTLLLGLLWAFHSGVQFLFHCIRTALPLKGLARG